LTPLFLKFLTTCEHGKERRIMMKSDNWLILWSISGLCVTITAAYFLAALTY
jgi:hypothetical protein